MTRPPHLLRLLLCLCFWPLALIALSSTAQAATGSLRLALVDEQTQRPLGDLQLLLIPREGNQPNLRLNTQSNALLDPVAPGLYDVQLTKPGYQSLRIPSIRVLPGKTTLLTLTVPPQKQNLDEVVVVGTTLGDDLLSSVGSSDIDREALRSAAGSGGDVLRALDGLPGLFSDGEYSSYTVRGAGPRDNLILVDGIPFDNLVHFSESFGEIEELEGGGRYSIFAPNLIARAQFQPGGWSAAYSGKTGSLLQLDVAEGNRDNASYAARLDVAGIELGYDGPSGLRDDTSLLFSARTYDFERLFDAIGLNDIGAPSLTDVIIKTSSQITERDKLNLLVIYAPEKFTRDINNVLASDEDEPGNYQDTSLSQRQTDNSLVGITWSRLIGGNAELNQQLYWRHFDERSSSGEAYPDLVPEGTAAGAIPQKPRLLSAQRQEREIGWQGDFLQDNSLGRLALGGRLQQTQASLWRNLEENWIRYTFDRADTVNNPNQRYRVLTPEALNSRYDESALNYALYADQEMAVEDWNFRAGARYDRDNFSQENLASPRASATWLATDALRLTTTIGRYYQTPRINDRAANSRNQRLRNSMADQISLGFVYNLNDDWDLFVEPYYQELDRLVVAEKTSTGELSNNGSGHSYGLDTAITRPLSNGWSINFKYSFNNAELQENPNQPAYDADFNRPHAASLGGVWEINSHWKLSARWKWASGIPRDTYALYSNVLGDGNPLRYSRETLTENTERYGSYQSVNFRADYRRSFGGTDIIAFIDVINLFGASNPSSSEFNERTGETEEDEGEAFPLVGLRFEW